MAWKIGTIILSLKTDIRLWTAGFKKANAEVSTFAGRLAFAQAGLLQLGYAATATGIVILGALGATVKVFSNLEQAIANTASVTSATAEEFIKLERYARKMGETTIFKSHEAANAMYYLGSAGYNVEQVMTSLKGTLDLAAATQYDLAETTRVVVTNLNAFQMGAAGAGRLANVFAASISTSQATMTRLAEALKYIAPLTHGLGISLEETVATLTRLYNAGLAAQQSGTALRMGLIRLQKPSEQAAEAMKRMGLNAELLNPQIWGLSGVLDHLNEVGAHTAEMGDEMAEIFGARAVTAWQVLARIGGKAIKQYEKRITDTNRASEMAAIQIDTLRGSYRLFTSAIQESANQIGKLLTPMVRGLFDSVRSLVYAFNALPIPIKQTSVAILTLVGSVALLTGPLLLLAALLPNIVAGFGLIGPVFATAAPWIIAVGMAVAGLTAIWIKHANAERKIRTQMIKTIAVTKEAYHQRKDNLHLFRELSLEYEELGKNADRTRIEEERYRKVIKQINDIMPGTIIKTEKFAENLNNVAIAGKKAKEELVVIIDKILEMKLIEISLEMSDTFESIDDLKKRFMDLRSYKDGLMVEKPGDQFKMGMEEINKVIRDGTIPTLKEVLFNIDKIQGKEVWLSAHKDSKKYFMSLKDLSKHLLWISEREGGILQIRKDQETLGRTISDIAKEKSSILNNAYEEKRELTDLEEKSISILADELQGYRDILDAYKTMIMMFDELAVSEQKIIDLTEEYRKTATMIGKEHIEIDDSEMEDIDVNAIIHLLFKRQDLEDYSKEVQKALKELGKSQTEGVEQSNIRVRRAYQQAYNQELTDISDHYKSRLDEIKEWEDKALLVVAGHDEDSKHITHKAYMERLAEEVKFYNASTALLKEYAGLSEETLKKQQDLEKYSYGPAGNYENKLTIYKKFLEDTLEEAVENGGQRLALEQAIADEIAFIDQELMMARMARLKRYADFTVRIFDVIGRAVGESIAGMSDAWKDALVNMINMLSKMATDYLLAMAGVYAAFGHWFKAAQYVAAAAGVQVLTAASAAAIYNMGRNTTSGRANVHGMPGAAGGGRIAKAGLFYGHANEVVVPATAARIDRMPSDYYKGAYEGVIASSSRLNRNRGTNIHMTIDHHLEGAMLSVNDKGTVDRFFRDILLPAEQRLKTAIESG